jgi:putative membrane protein
MALRKKFTDSDLERIKLAVREAEAKISGEIVPVLVSRSGYYLIANYKACLIAVTGTFLLLVFFDRFIPSLAIQDMLIVFLIVALMGVAGAMAPNFSQALKRMLIARGQLDHATRQRAESAFLEQEVFSTRHRTGIMIFVSFFENEVIVMGDRGISKVVDQKAWDKIVRDLTEKIMHDKVVDGLEAAIKKCGEILLEKGFKRTADDVNELRDDLRIE